jgi:hypothetical protein
MTLMLAAFSVIKTASRPLLSSVSYRFYNASNQNPVTRFYHPCRQPLGWFVAPQTTKPVYWRYLSYPFPYSF